ncbi:MAG: formate C-acetyltransferase [Sphingomonadales bacterium]|nr:formate C-acetyltransferase [Sphingomonadales bacterium]
MAMTDTFGKDAATAPMTSRIARMFDGLDVVRDGRFRVSIAKSRIMTASFAATEGQPQVLRVARAFAAVLAEIPVFIAQDDLLAGNLAAIPGGVELSSLWATWGEDELDALCAAGFAVDPADRPEIARINDYWQTRSLTSRMTARYDDQRLWPYAQLGVVLPAFRSKEEGWGPGGMIGCGWGIHHEISQIIAVFDYERVLREGLSALLAEAREKLAATRLMSADDVARVELLQAMVISLEAIVGFAGRLADAADAAAASESDPARAAELREMAAMCRHVPLNPARTFREAMQSLWIMWLMILPAGILSFGRLDQLLGDFYARDLAAGRIDEAAALELLQWLRIKDSHIVITSGQTHRKKYGGLAKWHNCTIGGQTPDGRDATNAVSHLLLKAARTCPTPHPTLTMRVHDGTPDDLLDEALELIGTGIGLPALLGDNSVIAFLDREGVSPADARNYAVAGCLGVNVIGQSRMVASPMFVAPMVLKFALHGGRDPATGKQVGPETPTLGECADFAEFEAAFRTQLAHFLELQAEFNNVTIQSFGERFPQPVESALMNGGIGAAKNILGRTLPFENGTAVNPIGLVNVADSLVAIRRRVFEERAIAPDALLAHLQSDWAGAEGQAARALMLSAPKYGNNDPEADAAAAALYRFCAETITALTTTYGGFQKAGSITIGTCIMPGGRASGATPDGRQAEEGLADESLTPMRRRDTQGLPALINSALAIDQVAWQALSLDLRLAPALFADAASRGRVAAVVRDYFKRGGKHIQFNVVSSDVLLDAQARPQAHSDLIVRIGGCSAYFTQLDRHTQDEIINRTEYADVD